MTYLARTETAALLAIAVLFSSTPAVAAEPVFSGASPVFREGDHKGNRPYHEILENFRLCRKGEYKVYGITV